MTATLQPTRSPLNRFEIESLALEARRLWNSEPNVGPDEREEILAELLELDQELERLALRLRWAVPSDADRERIASCADRLQDLRSHWRRSAA